MPIYHVKTPTGEHIVEANTPAAAVSHVVKSTITAKNLTATDLAYLLKKGLTLETAKADAAEPAAAQQPEGDKTDGQ